MNDEPQMPPLPAQIFLPDDQQAGAWAHGVVPTANANEIMFDFVLLTGHTVIIDDQERRAVQPLYRVVSRVRLPPAQMFEIMKALSHLLAEWEQRFGPVPRPGGADAPLFPPGDLGEDSGPGASGGTP